ncbi:MAG: hypothetical protein V3T77_04080 [Planctomycetota bacterium]
MAVVTTCDSCKKTFSAQDEYLGKKIKCPSCGVKVTVLSAAERREEQALQRQEDQWRREQEKRIALVESLGHGRGAQSFAVQYGTGLDRVSHFNPGAMTRFRKLRALSRFLLVSAYMLLALILVGAGITVFLWREGVVERVGVLALWLLGWLLLLVLVFCLLKFLGELSWLLADMGDHQLDVRNLLLDLRDDLGRVLAHPSQLTPDKPSSADRRT